MLSNVLEINVITVTESAKQELKKLLETKVDWPGARLRILERQHGVLGLGVDVESGIDEVVECDGSRILVIDPGLAARFDVVLDVDVTPAGAELVIS
jgi:Fe-S cluster assembly iron-binding protein IscA